MKHTSIVSLLCGTTLILAPVVHNLILLALVAHLLALNPSGDFHLNGLLDHAYQGWCLFFGFCLLVSGTVAGFLARGARGEAPATRPASPSPLAVPHNA